VSVDGGNDLERFLARLAAEAGTPVIDAAEADLLLDLARVVAHALERRFAPLTAYVLGLALDASRSPAERRGRVEATIEAVRRLAAEDQGGRAGEGRG
jgi:hypothetical protein